MRLQEGPRRKRIRIDDSDDEVLDSDEQSEAEVEAEDLHARVNGEEEESDDNSTEEEDGEDDDSNGSDITSHANTPPILLPQVDDDEPDSRISSRVTFKPRTANTTPPNTAPRTRSLPTSFEGMGISSVLVAALSKMSIQKPTEIQAACVPPLLEGESASAFHHDELPDIPAIQGRDCIGNAKTGSGKTIAFALPILQKLSLDPYGIFALVLTPTRYICRPHGEAKG